MWSATACAVVVELLLLVGFHNDITLVHLLNLFNPCNVRSYGTIRISALRLEFQFSCENAFLVGKTIKSETTFVVMLERNIGGFFSDSKRCTQLEGYEWSQRNWMKSTIIIKHSQHSRSAAINIQFMHIWIQYKTSIKGLQHNSTDIFTCSRTQVDITQLHPSAREEWMNGAREIAREIK